MEYTQGSSNKKYYYASRTAPERMEESVSGFKVQGDWGEIVEHGERVTRALEDAGITGKAFDEWNDWRPKSHELLSTDIREKTATHASVNQGKGEKAGEAPNDDIKTAGEKLAESYEKLEADEPDEAVEKWQDSIGYVARAADSAGRKALRSVEDTVYKRVMTQVAPYYFDNELISANIKQIRNQTDPFVLEVNVNDDELKEEIRELLDTYDTDITRWHVTTEKNTEAAEAAEGVEAPNSTDSETDATTT